MNIDITAVNSPNFLKNYGVARDIADAQLEHSVDRKIIEWQADASRSSGEVTRYAQKLAFGNPWTTASSVNDQNTSVTLGDYRQQSAGTCTHFDATTTVNCGDFRAFNRSFSSVIWFKTSNTDTTAGMISYYTTTPDPNRGFRMYLSTSGQVGGFCSPNGSTGVAIAGASSSPAMGAGYNDGQWHLLAVTFSEGSWQFFLDGLLAGVQDTSPFTEEIFAADTPLVLGSNYNGAENWVGELFDFQSFGRVLTNAEVEAIWKQGASPYVPSAGLPTDPLIRYGLDNGSTVVALPSAGVGADQYAATKPFTATDWSMSDGTFNADGTVTLSGAYVSLRPNSAANRILAGGQRYKVSITVKDWYGGHIQIRPYASSGTTVPIVTLQVYSASADPTATTTVVGYGTVPAESSGAGLSGYINLQSNSGGTTRQMTVLDFVVQPASPSPADYANIVGGNDDTVYRGSDVPYSNPNLLGQGRHCRYRQSGTTGQKQAIRLEKTGVTTGVTPNIYEFEFICTQERRLGTVRQSIFTFHVNPYRIETSNGILQFAYTDNTGSPVVAVASEEIREGEEFHYKIRVDRAGMLVRFTNMKSGVVTDHTMVNMIAASISGQALFGGFAYSTAINYGFDGSIDYFKLTDINTGTFAIECDWRRDGLVDAADPKVVNDPQAKLTLRNGGPELLVTPAATQVPTQDSYGNGVIQKKGVCPKAGKLVSSAAGTFNGSNTYADTNVDVNGWTAISCSFWARLDDAGASYPMPIATSSPSQGFEMYFAATTRQMSARLKNGAWKTIISPLLVNIGEWNHFAATYDQAGGKLKLYQNGVLAAETSASQIVADIASDLHIGGRGSVYIMDGPLCDMQVYDDALTADEVAFVYNGTGTDPTAANLQAHWPMTEGTGVRLTDVSGAGKDCTVLNMAEEAFWANTQEVFHYAVQKGCDVVGSFPTAGGLGKIATCPQPAGADSCYSFWFNSQNNSATSNLFRNSGIACTILPTNLRFTYASIIDYHFHTAGTLAEDAWHHCVISVDDNDATLYLNGVFSQTITGSQNPNQGGTIFIGGYGTLGGLFQMAEFIVMDRPVTGAAEAASIYAGNVPSGALGAYSLANTLEDSTGNTSPTSTGNFAYREVPARQDKASLFRTTLSHPAGIGLNSIKTQIDTTPEDKAAFLHSSRGYASFNRRTLGQIGTQIADGPYGLLISGMTMSYSMKTPVLYNAFAIGGFANDYINMSGANVIIFIPQATPSVTTISGLSFLPINNWNHFVWRFGSTGLDIWINGVKQTKTWVDPVGDTASSEWRINRIGGWGTAGTESRSLDGDMKNVAFFSEALTDSQCGSLENKMPTGVTPSGRYLLESNFLDTSGNGLHLRSWPESGVQFGSANFGSETYLGEALFDTGAFGTWNWVWNVDNQFNQGFDISFTMSTRPSSSEQVILWGGDNSQPKFVVNSGQQIAVYIGGTATALFSLVASGTQETYRVVWSQDSGGSSTLHTYRNGSGVNVLTIMSPMMPSNTVNARFGRDATAAKSFAGTLKDVKIKLNGGTEYVFPFADSGDDTTGAITATYTNANETPLFRAVGSSLLGINSGRVTPSSATSTNKLLSEIQTKGY